jgi:hypothetical protein
MSLLFTVATVMVSAIAGTAAQDATRAATAKPSLGRILPSPEHFAIRPAEDQRTGASVKNVVRRLSQRSGYVV